MASDRALIDRFLAGGRDGTGPRLRIDGDMLAVHGPRPPDWVVVLRAAADVYMLREDPPDAEARALRDAVAEGLRDRGLQPAQLRQQAFAEVAATILAAIRDPAWEVWAGDDDRASATIERILVGDPPVTVPASPDEAPGMTLAELFGDLDRELDEIARHLSDPNGER